MRALQLYQHLTEVIKRGLFRQVPLVVEYLSVDLDERDDNGRTPIMLCAYVTPETCGVSLARTLIEKGCALDLRDKYGLSVMHYACIYERLQLVKVLLRALQSSANVKDRFGCTPLHYAVRAGNSDITQVLTNYYTHFGLSLNTVNREGKSPLQEAYHFGHVVCARILYAATSNKNLSSEKDDSTNGRDQICQDTKTMAVVEVEEPEHEEEHANRHQSTSDELTPPATTPRVETTRVNSPGTTIPSQSLTTLKQPSSKVTEEVSAETTTVTIVSLTKTNALNSLTAPMKTITVTSPIPSKDNIDQGRWATKCNRILAPVSASTSLTALQLETSGSFKGRHMRADDELESQTHSPSVEKREAVRKMLTRRSAYVLNQMSKPNEWNVTQLIAPSDNDYRNDPSYVISVSDFAQDRNVAEKKRSVTQTPISSMPLGANNISKPAKRPTRTWRNDLKKLFDHYEYHCSLSYRHSARPPEASNRADLSEGKDNETSHGGSSTLNASMDRFHRRQRRSSNFSRSSVFTDTQNQKRVKSRRSSILSQQSSGIVTSSARTGNAAKEYTRTVSSDSTRSNASSQKPNHA